MVRSVWKGPFVDGHLIKKVQTHLKESINKPIKEEKKSTTLGLWWYLCTCYVNAIGFDSLWQISRSPVYFCWSLLIVVSCWLKKGEKYFVG